MKLGLNAKLYRNTGSFATPTWTEMTNVKDLSCGDEMGEADVSTRGSGGFNQSEPTLRALSLEFGMPKKDGDADFTALLAAYSGRTSLDLAVMDGDIVTTGNNGIRARWKIFDFSREENLEDVQMISVSMKPCYDTDGPPEDMTIA